MNPREEIKKRDPADDEHTVKMWEPLGFRVFSGYDYLKKGKAATFFYYLCLSAAFLILNIWNRAVFGMRIRGRKNLRLLRSTGAVVVCNHTHLMDCTVLECALFPSRSYFTTLESNFRIPVLRHLIKLFGGVPIPSSVHCMKEFFDNMQQALENRDFVCFYPEGALHPYETKVRSFKDGAFRTAAMAGKAVIPAVITFRDPGWLMSIYRAKPCVTLTLLEPVYPSESEKPRDDAARMKNICYEKMKGFAEDCYGKMA